MRSSFTSRNRLGAGASKKRTRWKIGGVVVSMIVLIFIVLLATLVSSKNKNSDANSSPSKANTSSGSSSSITFANRPSVESVTAYLVEHDVTDQVTFDDMESPQYKAAQWLAEKDGAHLQLPTLTIHATEVYLYVFRYVMALNFLALGDFDWMLHFHFLSNKTVCDWNELSFGVLCDNDNNGTLVPVQLILCTFSVVQYIVNHSFSFLSSQSFSVTLNLTCTASNKLKGQIPSENGKLSTLQFLDLGTNGLTGTIPPRLCSLLNLKDLMLRQNQLNGTLPTCLGALQRLELLGVSHNKLTGTLPTQLESLLNLRSFYVDNNAFTGDPFLVFSRLYKLQQLVANNNKFFAAIDATSLARCNELELIDLSHNNFSSTAFPEHWCNLPLHTLDLSKNKLAGKLPGVCANKHTTRLTTFAANDNNLTGSLNVFGNMSELVNLDLTNNALTGSIDVFGNVSKLEVLFLSENPFDAEPIPTSFMSFKSLTALSLRNTNRIGPLPNVSRQMFLIDFGSNQLNGTIPTTYGGSTSRIAYLLLNNNLNISGSLPASFREMKKLRIAALDGTALSNATMREMCKLSQFSLKRPLWKEIFYADCLNCTCSGCQCCAPGDNFGCSRPLLANLDLTWTNNFRGAADDYDLRNESADADNSLNLPPV